MAPLASGAEDVEEGIDDVPGEGREPILATSEGSLIDRSVRSASLDAERALLNRRSDEPLILSDRYRKATTPRTSGELIPAEVV